MYSIVIAIIFFAFAGWLLKREWAKDPSARNVWSMLTAITSLVIGVAVMLVWLTVVFL